MAVPKKRTSKSKTQKRKTVWKKIALKQSIKAYSLYSIAVKKKLKNSGSDVVLDQKPQGLNEE